MKAGAYGGKLAGAGGGFLYLLVPKEKKIHVINELKELTRVSIEYEPRGQEFYLVLYKSKDLLWWSQIADIRRML